MTIDFSGLFSWLNAPGVLWALLFTHGPAILWVHFSKTVVCTIVPLGLLNAWQRRKGQPEFTMLCARPRKGLTFVYAWLVASVLTDWIWPHTVPLPIEISWTDWKWLNGIFSPALVLAVLALSNRFEWLKPLADFLGSNEYDPQAAADELAKAQTPLRKLAAFAKQSQRGATKVVIKADGSEVEVPSGSPTDHDAGDRTKLPDPPP